MTSQTEVLIIGCLGLGHYNPTLQVARACASQIRSLNKTPKITLISPLSRDMALRVLSAGETENLEIDRWIERRLDDGDIEQFIFVLENLPPGHATMEVLIKRQDEWLPYIRNIYTQRDTKADMILADMVVHIDIPLAQEWGCRNYTFWPSPLTCHYMIPKLYAQLIESTKDAAANSEPSTESTVSEGSEPAPLATAPASVQTKMTFGGIPDLELDIDGETLQLDKLASAAFMKMHLDITAARSGVVCNDVAGFYPPEFLESCKMDENFSVIPIGPLATHFEQRLKTDVDQKDEIIEWLDTKADKSCIFFSVGSYFDLPPAIIMTFTKALSQLVETDDKISILWAHRPVSKFTEITEYKADAAGLPEGWVDSHGGRIKIKSWVNQPRILQHPALGLFMTHSGWNGLLEAVSLGHAPLLLLPVNSEQPANAKIMESYKEVGERLWRNIGEISTVDENHIINKINSCFNNEKYTRNLAKLQRTAVEAWDAPNGSSRMNLQKLLEGTSPI